MRRPIFGIIDDWMSSQHPDLEKFAVCEKKKENIKKISGKYIIHALIEFL